MRILTICQAYPNIKNPSSMAFVHSRNLLYKEAGHEVDVLSFSAEKEYLWEGVRVFSEKQASNYIGSGYDTVVFHAPNLRNHLRLWVRYKRKFKNLVFVVHMDEWIDRVKYYPKPYPFLGIWKKSALPIFQRIYDQIKLYTWRKLLKPTTRLKLIFVSDWIREQAEKSIGLNFNELGIATKVIHNPIHPAFVEAEFEADCIKDADFVTIRPFDDSKYGVDIVCEMAERYPQYTFHIFGRGEYFSLCPTPKNVKVVDRIFPQHEIPQILNRYRAAILPTRLDSQGVLMCEIAATGMPLIVSDLSICKEMVGNFSNVAFISNIDPKLFELPPVDIEGAKKSSQKFLARNTTGEELQVFRR